MYVVYLFVTKYRTKLFFYGAPFVSMANEMKIMPESEYLKTHK